MFDYSPTELTHIKQTLEPLLSRARERSAEAEQLAMDATRLLSVRAEQMNTIVKQPFYVRLYTRFTGGDVRELQARQADLFELQKIGWKYIEMLNERDLMLAHSMVSLKNNLMTLAVKEEETRALITGMVNRIADRFEGLEKRVGELESQQNIHSWLLTVETCDYDSKYPPHLRVLKLIQDFCHLKNGQWSLTEIRYLQKAMKETGLPWKNTITLADFIDGTIDEIEQQGFGRYHSLIELSANGHPVAPQFILEHISVPSYKSLYRIADSYGSSSDTIDILADQLSIDRQSALKKVLRGFIEKEGIDTRVAIEWRDLAVELLGCHGLVMGLIDQPAFEPGNTQVRVSGSGSETPTALDSLHQLAERGDAEAQYKLGQRYEKGDGVTEDAEEAVNWYRKAAEQGYAEAQYELGGCYYYGFGIDEDNAQAVNWYRKAAEQGHAQAQFYLGVCYGNGEGITKDLVQAVNWYRKAAEQGQAEAQLNLGFCYQNSDGVTEDPVEAVSWYRKAAEQGNANAQCNLGLCYVKNYGVTEDLAQAASWFRKAAEQEYAVAQYLLGLCYAHGEGVTQNWAQAVSWYRKAAEWEDADAQYQLGICYKEGDGVTRDSSKAVNWFRKAAEQGHGKAQFNLGLCYHNGDGVTEDYAQAASWYRKAAEQGEENAEWLADLLESAVELGESVQAVEDKKQSGDGCFITTATLQTLGIREGADILNEFRRFRDGWLQQQPFGVTEIAHYYRIAPDWVTALDQHPDSTVLYTWLWRDYLTVCRESLQQSDYLAVYHHYRAMLDALADRLGTTL